MSAPPGCPRCGRAKNRRHYLCSTCWAALSDSARTALNKRDSMAYTRLRELLEQIHGQVPPHQISISL
jgi:transposase-like protein